MNFGSMKRVMANRHLGRWLGPLMIGAALLVPGLRAGDWPEFLGPDRNGVSTESVPARFPAGGPRQLWSMKIGSGWSGPVVVGGRVLIHHRRGSEEVLESLDAGTGKSIWKSSQPTHYEDDFGFDDGPRGTPCVAEGRVFTFGAEGRLTATQLADGKLVWTRPLGAELHGNKGFFGFACSPLVVSNLVIIQLGGADGAGIVALRSASGEVAWKATSDEASYASPIRQDFQGAPRVVAFNREGLVILDAATGAVRLRHPWRSRTHASVNATAPMLWQGQVFLTSSYDTGAVLLDVAGAAAKPVWSGDEALSAHYASMVPLDGVVFGYHGRAESRPVFRCVDLATGKVRWSESGSGGGNVLRAGATLILLRDSGELQLAPADPVAFKPTDRVQILGTQTRAVPALSGGVLFARDRTQLVAVRLGE